MLDCVVRGALDSGLGLSKVGQREGGGAFEGNTLGGIEGGRRGAGDVDVVERERLDGVGTERRGGVVARGRGRRGGRGVVSVGYKAGAREGGGGGLLGVVDDGEGGVGTGVGLREIAGGEVETDGAGGGRVGGRAGVERRVGGAQGGGDGGGRAVEVAFGGGWGEGVWHGGVGEVFFGGAVCKWGGDGGGFRSGG